MRLPLVRARPWGGARKSIQKRYVASTSADNDTAAVVAREVSSRQDLYLTDPISPGSTFFLPNGTKVFNKLIQFMKLQQQNKFGFQEVITPLIYRKSLWEQSGHWENYKDDMFRVEGNDCAKEEYGLKPMNCPGHCVMFKRFDRSYTELPLRFSDFSPLHRNEASGALSGLTRVRKFHQDDGHIFCTPEQVEGEIEKCLQLVDLCYGSVLPLGETSDRAELYTMCLSTRPEKYVGELDVWNHAESVLKSILDNSGKQWSINEGDGAFYGPKVDIKVKDHTGKYHQVATIQLDFQLPERFDMRYKDADNTYKRPIMIHRAVFGSVERFMALLLDSNKGNWPFWLNPHQCMVLPVSASNGEMVQAAKALVDKLCGRDTSSTKPVELNSFHFNAEIDLRDESVGYRLRDAISRKYSYIVLIGAKELAQNKVAVRSRDSSKIQMMSTEELYDMFCDLERKYK
ncbi:FAER105Wp [Eremothecium gossypii FDAG1]|nr:FAER105Wp [Eremothecium gossypii FDAG1]